jgi:hypothetical protein
LDIFDKVGKNHALDFTYKDVEVTEGRLQIEFVYQVEYPCIAAIAVEGPATRKINCGGEAYKDYKADWPASNVGGQGRYLASADFYADWAAAEFGPDAAKEAGDLFARIDCRLPRPSDWVDGPGGIKPDPRPWSEVQKEYAFVDDLAKLREKVKSPGHLERLDYWLNNFRFMRTGAEINCAWHRYNEAIKKAKAEKDAAAQKKIVKEQALPVRKEIVAMVKQLHVHLLATVSTTGEMGTVTNWQQHNLPGLLYKPTPELAALLGEQLPNEALPSREYPGESRLFVPVVRTTITAGEPLVVSAVALGVTPADAAIYWRPLGGKEFAKVAMAPTARGVLLGVIAAENAKEDFEYYVEVVPPPDAKRAPLRFPATAPELNQSVVVVEGK